MDYNKVYSDYKKLFPTKVTELENYTSWNSWQRSIGRSSKERMPYIEESTRALLKYLLLETKC